jgi:hypothetical protein
MGKHGRAGEAIYASCFEKFVKKKDKQKVKSAGQPYNTRSKGAPSHMSFRTFGNPDTRIALRNYTFFSEAG